MNCNVCGTEVTNPAAVFCPNCGAKLGEPAPTPAPAAAAAAAAAPAAPDQRQSALFPEDWAPIVKTGEWLGSLLILLLVPIALSIIAGLVGQLTDSSVIGTALSLVAVLSSLVIMLIFAFGKRFNPNKRNFFKAYLILFLISIVLCIILGIVLVSFFAANSSSLTEITDMLNNLPV